MVAAAIARKNRRLQSSWLLGKIPWHYGAIIDKPLLIFRPLSSRLTRLGGQTI
jgi:hypothetical protein